MAEPTIYTRVYSRTSPRQLVSGKGAKGDSLSESALNKEFDNHRKGRSPRPTALVSCSTRIVDTMKRAFDKHYIEEESAEDIWIAFIAIPARSSPSLSSTTKRDQSQNKDKDTPRIHSARALAERLPIEKPWKFTYEVVFEWAIPEKYVTHQVSLQTILDRGFQDQYFRVLKSTSEVLYHIAQQFKLRRHDPYGIGITLGTFAQKFGARAPLDWISHQLFDDCMDAETLNHEIVKLSYGPQEVYDDNTSGRKHDSRFTEIVGFDFFSDLDDGIETALIDWWLSDDVFGAEVKAFEEWRGEMEDGVAWELVDLWESWYGVDGNGKVRVVSEKEKLLCDSAMMKSLGEHEKKREDIEAEAVRIGL